MHSFFDKIARVFGWMDAAEFIVAAILAVGLLIAAPLVVSFCFIRAQHYMAATFSGSLWILAAIACIRDYRHGHFGWLSATFGLLWLVTTLTLLWILEAI